MKVQHFNESPLISVMDLTSTRYCSGNIYPGTSFSHFCTASVRWSCEIIFSAELMATVSIKRLAEYLKKLYDTWIFWMTEENGMSTARKVSWIVEALQEEFLFHCSIVWTLLLLNSIDANFFIFALVINSFFKRFSLKKVFCKLERDVKVEIVFACLLQFPQSGFKLI